MREFTKSMMSYTWAMSVFGVQQMVNVFRPSQATESFDNVTEATRDEFGDGLRAAFRAGDNLQRGMVDLAFGMFGLGMFNGRGRGCGVSDMGRRSGDVIRESVNAAGQAADAFGRVTQGAASYAADTTRQGTGRTNRRGARCDNENYDRNYDRDSDYRRGHYSDRDYDRNSGRGNRATSDVGQQTADAVGQGIRAMGEAADAVGRTVEGVAYSAAAAADGDQTSRRGASAGQTQSWGAPSRGSGKSRRS